MNIAIVDYGLGNLESIMNMFRRIDVEAAVTGDLGRIESATKLVLPGVGAFDAAMARINDSGLREVLDRRVLVDRVPVLGLCLGMQLMTRGSEEGHLPGLAWIAGETRRFPADDALKVPHMGWNRVHPMSASPLTQGLPLDARFYFVHSYYVLADSPAEAILATRHGIEFHSGIQRERIMGVQFHPEKSHRFGMQLLRNFADVQC